jgi:TolB-like protein/AraC-like DNA-binding protein
MNTRADHFIGTQTKPTFLQKLEEVVEANLQNDQFSVEALADQMNMSRSNLHRKLKQTTGQTANQFVREYRLERAMDLLKKEEKTITEVAYEVGFSSQSYFTSCFSEYYGYPPGEAKIRAKEAASRNLQVATSTKRPPLAKVFWIAASLVIVVVLSVFWFTHSQLVGSEMKEVTSPFTDRSVAVLPLKNLNLDQEYEYFSEGVVVAINRHLSQVKDLVLISPLSTGRYREHNLSARQIGQELQVAHLLLGNIQRHDDNIRIEVRLVDTQTEQQVWAESYDRQWQDILEIQGDIAGQVAQALQTKLPENQVNELIQQAVNPEAYDLFMKGSYEVRSYSRKSNLRACLKI